MRSLSKTFSIGWKDFLYFLLNNIFDLKLFSIVVSKRHEHLAQVIYLGEVEFRIHFLIIIYPLTVYSAFELFKTN